MSRNINDKTWFDMAGDFHSDALHVVERYRMTGRDTIEYEATIEDSKVFHEVVDHPARLPSAYRSGPLFEYVCQAEHEEENGLFTREDAHLVSGRWKIDPPAPSPWLLSEQ